MASQPVFPYMVPASQFLAWWQRVVELEAELPEEMSEFEWLSRGQPIRALLSDLVDVGIAAGAVIPYARDNPDGSIEFGERIVPDFDWEHGEIDFQARRHLWSDGIDRAPSLVARLVKTTGIPEDPEGRLS